MSKLQKPIYNPLIPDVPLFKRDNIHLTLQQVDSYNKKDNYLITTRNMGKSTVMWARVYKQAKAGLIPIIMKTRPVTVTQMWIDDIARELNKFRKPSEYCSVHQVPGSDIRSGTIDLEYIDQDMEEPAILCRVICISIDVSRFKGLVLPNVGDIFIDEFMPDVRHGEKWLQGYTWRANTLWTTFSRFKWEVQHKVMKRYWFGNPYSRFVPPLFEQYKVNTLDLKPGNIIVGEDFLVSLATPCPELRQLMEKENPTALNEINKEWYDFLNGEFTADNEYDFDPVLPKGYKLVWCFRVCNTYIGAWVDSEDIDWSGWNPFRNKWWIGMLPPDYSTKQHKVYAFDFNDFVKGSNLIQQSDKGKMSILKLNIAQRNVTFQDVNVASIVEQLYEMI